MQEKRLGPFDILKTLTQTKVLDDPNDEFEAAYIPFLINKGLSLYHDTVLFANDMNMAAHIPSRQQFDYYLHGIKIGRRYSKWPKKIAPDENLELIKEYFGYNTLKAKQALALLSEEQIEQIKIRSSKGGIID